MADAPQSDAKPEASREEKAFRKRAQEFLLPLSLSLLLTLLSLVLWGAGAFVGPERLVYDGLFQARHALQPGREAAWQAEAAKEIAIVEYDELTKQLLGIKGAPPRRHFTKFVKATTEGKARVLAFDYYFPRQAYPDSRTRKVEEYVRNNAKRLVSLLPPRAEDEGAPAAGLARISPEEFFVDLGFFRDPSPEQLRGIDPVRWKAFRDEVRRRQQELHGAIAASEKEFDGILKSLDPNLVAALDAEGGDFSLAIRRLSATIVNSLLEEDLNLASRILWASNVVLAKFIDEGGNAIQDSDPLFQAVSQGGGLINAVKDSDGVLRSIPLVRMDRHSRLEFFLSLATVLARDQILEDDVKAWADDAHAGTLPLPSDSLLRVNFIGPVRSIRYIPIYRFLLYTPCDACGGTGAAEGAACKACVGGWKACAACGGSGKGEGGKPCERCLGLRYAMEGDPRDLREGATAGREIEGPVKREEIEGRVLLMGDTTRDGQDFIATPVSRIQTAAAGELSLRRTGMGTLAEMPGVETHAHAVFNILHDLWLKPLGTVPSVFLFLAIGGVSLLFYWQRMGFLWSGVLSLALLAGESALTLFAFTGAFTLVPLIPALCVIGLNFVGGVAYQGIMEQMKKKAVTSMFGKYVSENLVRKMVSGELEVELKGRKKELTVLFSDIRGFTTLSEGLDPETVAYILRTYFTRMIGKVFENGGTLDKLMGDAVMAFFGDPEDMPDHPAHACECTIGMLEALDDLRRNSGIKGMEKINIGIGLNTGPMTVGNLGSGEYFSYTVIGDNVNFGSRLEGLNKAFGTNILVSASTRDPVADKFEFRRLGTVTVVGKTLPVAIYELMGRKGAISEERARVRGLFEQGLDLWKDRKFAEAAAKFEEALKIRDDGPSRVFLDLSRHNSEEPPPPDWNGSFVPKGK